MSTAERAECINTIEAFPAQLRALVDGLSDEQLSTRHLTDEWPVDGIVHHMADSHMNSFIRLMLILSEKKPTLKPYDQDAWWEITNALDVEPTVAVADSLRLLEGLHRRWVRVFRGLNEAQWERSGYHPEIGLVTVDDLAQMYDEHCRDHLAQVERVLAAMG